MAGSDDDIPDEALRALPTPPPAPPYGAPIDLPQAIAVAEAAMREAETIGIAKAIAIVEPSGDLVYFARMDGAPYSATKLAQGKAIAAARYRRPTAFFCEEIGKGQLFFLTFPEMVAGPGGIPLVRAGRLIGAIGVSGGNGLQDVQVATAAIRALDDTISG